MSNLKIRDNGSFIKHGSSPHTPDESCMTNKLLHTETELHPTLKLNSTDRYHSLFLATWCHVPNCNIQRVISVVIVKNSWLFFLHELFKSMTYLISWENF